MKTAIMIVITLVPGAYPLYSTADEQPPPKPVEERQQISDTKGKDKGKDKNKDK